METAVVVQLVSCILLFATLWTVAPQASLSLTISQSLSKFKSIELVMLSNHLILCHLLLLLPSVFATISVFSSELALGIRCPNYWSVNGISPSNEYSGLISFRVDWFDHPVVQETLKSLLQHHNLKASVLQCSAFFMVQFSYPYMTARKSIPLTIWNLSAKWYLCFFKMLSRFVITFLPRSKGLLISWLQSLLSVILEPKKIKSVWGATIHGVTKSNMTEQLTLSLDLYHPIFWGCST